MSDITREEMEPLVHLVCHHRIPNSTITIVTLQLESGYTVSGESACTRPEMYDERRGIELAKDKAFEKLARLLEFQRIEDEWRSGVPFFPAPTQALALRTHPGLLIAAQAVDLAVVMSAKRAEYGHLPDALNIAWSNLRAHIAEAGGKVAE